MPQKKFKNFIENALTAAKDLIKLDDFGSLIKAVEAVNRVLKISDDNNGAIELRDNIDINLKDYRKSVNQWFADNELDIRPKISKVFQELERLVECLNFQKIMELIDRQKKLLTYLCDVSTDKINNDRFIEKCGVLGNPSSTPGQTLNSRTQLMK